MGDKGASFGGKGGYFMSSAVCEVVPIILSNAHNEIQHGPNVARLVDKFGFEFDKPTALDISAGILTLLNDHLAEHDWLALEHPTIADCAVMPYVAIAPEGGISLDDYPHILAWIDRIKQLPGFIGMPGQI